MIEFHYLPERDHPLLNFEEGGILIALGAALQNAELEARAQGFAPWTSYVASGSCVAVMELVERGSLDASLQALHGAIFRRHTNRKAYRKVPLARDLRSTILDCQPAGSDLMLSLVESEDAMSEVGRALSTMEETALANERLHEIFFRDILWSDADNRAGKPGLYLKTLELPPPAQLLFRLLHYWRIAKMLAKIGLPGLVAKQNAVQNALASAFGIIAASHTNRAVYLEIGQMLERIWLFATARGLSLQIVTGITFLARALNRPDIARLFTAAQQARVRSAYETIKKNVDEGREPILVFRIGTSEEPTAVTYRRSPDVAFLL